MSRVRRTVELAEAQGDGNVLVLNTGGAALPRREAAAVSAVSPDATVSERSYSQDGWSAHSGMAGVKYP